MIIPDLSQRRYPPDPQDAEVYAHCDECGGEIYVGESVWRCGTDLLCKVDCFLDYMGAESISAGKEETE